MAKFTLNQLGLNVGKTDVYFRLKDNMEKARIAIRHHNSDDIELDIVHRVQKDGRTMLVKCEGDVDEKGIIIKDTCRLCKDKIGKSEKVTLDIYNYTLDKPQLWTLGQGLINKLIYLMSQYDDLEEHVFEVTRIGKANDQTTTYEIVKIGDNDKTYYSSIDKLERTYVYKTIDDLLEDNK